jgi:Sodium/hydrogen exchanger family
MLFLGLGFVVGDRGLELVSVGLDSRLLEVVAIVTLSLVLFLDAVNLELTELRRDWLAPLLVLGPATLLVAGLLAGAGMLLLDLPVVLAALLGTILASTDPVVGVVVLVSVVAHGVTATPLSGWYARRASQETLAEERAGTAAELFGPSPDDIARVTPAELTGRLADVLPLSSYSSLTPMQDALYIRQSPADRPPAGGRSPDPSPRSAAQEVMLTSGIGRAGGDKHAGLAHDWTAGVDKARE